MLKVPFRKRRFLQQSLKIHIKVQYKEIQYVIKLPAVPCKIQCMQVYKYLSMYTVQYTYYEIHQKSVHRVVPGPARCWGWPAR